MQLGSPVAARAGRDERLDTIEDPLEAELERPGRVVRGPDLLPGGGAYRRRAWPAQYATPMAVAWPLLLVAVFLPLSVRRYRRLSR